MALELRKLSETANLIVLGWTPPAGVEWYVFFAADKRVSNAPPIDKDGAVKDSIQFHKTSPGPPFEVAAICRVDGELVLEVGRYQETPDPPPPPPPSDAYFDVDYASGRFERPWVRLHNSSGQQGIGVTQTPDGRVAVVRNPVGSGNCARFEIRNDDAPWPPKPDVNKSEAVSTAPLTFDKPAIAVGDVRWFRLDVLMPWSDEEKFLWPTLGSDRYQLMAELHTQSGQQWAPFRLSWSEFHAKQGGGRSMMFQVYGGQTHSSANYREAKLWPVTDSQGNRVMANHNRWIKLVWGMKFAPDNTGWLEAWVDGVNVYPRAAGPNMWVGDLGQYFKVGLYKSTDGQYAAPGRSVIYYGRTRIGMTKADVE